jgi:hypothetical protein
MSFLSNGGKFKLYTVLNGLIFPTPIQPRISFELAIFFFNGLSNILENRNKRLSGNERKTCEKKSTKIKSPMIIIMIFFRWK